MKIAVVGVGGVGGYFGGRLAQTAAQVQFLARPKTCQVMRDQGLRVESIHGDFHLHSVAVFDDVSQMEQPEVVLVAVKTWQLPTVAAQMLPLLGENTVVIPLQNGVESVRVLEKIIDPSHVVPGMCRILSHKVAAGHIRHSGHDPDVHFGSSDGRWRETLDRLQQRFTQAGVVAKHHEDMDQVLWRKFLFVVTMGTVGALTRAPIGVIRNSPEVRALLEQSLAEIAAVAAAYGVKLTPENLAQTMKFIDGLPEAGIASMHRDLIAGQPSEMEAWTGAVVRLGSEKGVETPFYKMAYACLLPAEKRARGEWEF